MTRALLLVLVLGVCASDVVAQEPPDSIELTRWWNSMPRPANTLHLYIYEMMQECMDVEGRPFDEIRWLSADFLLAPEYVRLGGLWVGSISTIILAHSQFNDPEDVSHELGHVLLTGTNDDHDDPRFQRCTIKELVAP